MVRGRHAGVHSDSHCIACEATPVVVDAATGSAWIQRRRYAEMRAGFLDGLNGSKYFHFCRRVNIQPRSTPCEA